MSYWHGKRAVVTGGSAGIGRTLAGELIGRGARVAIVARDHVRLEAAVADLHTLGGSTLAIAADVTQDDGVRHVAEIIGREWGGVDLLCHCVGRSMRGDTLSTSVAKYRELWEANFLSAVRCVQAFAEPLKVSRGHIVLMGSLASKVAPRYLGAYPASKFPLAALAQQLRLELAEHGVHVLLVCPGPIARVGASDAVGRYTELALDVPAAAHRPGGGAKVRAIDPRQLSGHILRACERRRAELVVPARARALFALAQLSPRLGDSILKRMTSA